MIAPTEQPATWFNRLAGLLNFGYDAVEATPGRRRPSPLTNRSEDAELPPEKRRQLVAQTREIHRNFAVAGWMIRRHLDYCATFNFQSKTGDRKIDRLVEDLVDGLNEPETWDIAARHGLSAFTRLAEARRTLDGDIGVIKLRDGRVQVIEGDRIRNPEGPAKLPDAALRGKLTHGLQLDAVGRTLAYAVHRRTPTTQSNPTASRFEFERMVPASALYLHAHYDRFDQVRGISPLAPAVNTLVDLYEGIDYALAKLKIAQLFALAFFRGDPTSISPGETNSEGGQDYTKIPLDGPKILDLDIGDRAEFMESKTPSSEFQNFTTLLIQLVLKALDIPYSFFNESFSTYSGSRLALIQYELAATVKRRDTQQLLRHLTRWKIAGWIADGRLPARPAEFYAFRWDPAGLPWIDPQKEVAGQISALNAGLTSRQRILRKQGEDLDDILDELSEEERGLAERGLASVLTPPTQPPPETPTNAD